MNAKYIYQNALQSSVFSHFADIDGSWNGLSVADVFGDKEIKVGYVLAPGAHSQFGSGKNTQFEPEQRANPFENVFSKTAVFPPPAIAETDL